MFTTGDIVIHNDLTFTDSYKDDKIGRPCVVLFTLNVNNEELICTCPLTTQVNTFNKRHNSYCLIPDVIYKYKKLNFASLANIDLRKSSNASFTGIRINKETVDLIINKYKSYTPTLNRRIEVYNKVSLYLKYVELFDKLEKNIEINNKRKERNLKRRLAKNTTIHS